MHENLFDSDSFSKFPAAMAKELNSNNYMKQLRDEKA